MTSSKPNSIKLLIVTVNYFSASLIAKLVDQLAKQTLPERVNLSAVCVDNSVSPEQQTVLERVKTEAPFEFKLVISPVNLGFGRAINKGLEGEEFDYVCCVNPDVGLLPDTLNELLSYCLKESGRGIWGGVTVDQQSEADFRHAWQEPSLRNTLAWALGLKRIIGHQLWQDNYRHMAQNMSQPYPVDSVSGCCIMISNPAWQALEGFDLDFFLYSEEIDLCRRARRMDFQPTIVPLCKLNHTSHSEQESTSRLLTIYSSKLLYASKHHGPLYNFCYRLIIVLGSLVRIFKSVIFGRIKTARAWASIAWCSLVYRQNYQQQMIQ